MEADKVIGLIAGNDSVKDSVDCDGRADGFLFMGSPRPEAGFHFGYLMYVPLVLREMPVLIVEGPAVGEAGPMERACEIVYDKAVFELSIGGFPHRLARKLQCLVIMPLFPRPEDKENNTNIFTHALTGRAMSVSGSSAFRLVERIDLQLIAIFEDIKNRFLCGGSGFMINLS